MKAIIAEAFNQSEAIIGELLAKYVPDFREGRIKEREFWIKIGKELNKPIPDNWKTLWRREFSKKLVISKEVLDWLKVIKQRGLFLVVVSNIIPPYAEVIRKRHGYDGFDLVINSCEVGTSKPKKEIYELLLHKLSFKPEEIIFADDRYENLIPASDLGMKIVLVANPKQLITDVEKLLL